jgi:hypothetical protein
MSCASTPQLVHIRWAAYPRTRCAGCNRRLISADESHEGAFTIVTPACVVMIRATVCVACLSDPALKDGSGIQRLALAIVRRLSDWYATPRTQFAPRAHSRQTHVAEPGLRKQTWRTDA